MDDQEFDPEPSLALRARAGRSVRQEIGPWRVRLAWPRDVDQGGPWAVIIEPGPDATEQDIAGGLGSGVLRRIDFSEAAEQWRAMTLDGANRGHQARLQRRGEVLRALAEQGITERYLAALSAFYVSLVQQGAGNVTATLAEAAGKAPETIRTHLKEARKRGLLTSTGGGRAGGRLTDQARSLLEQESEL